MGEVPTREISNTSTKQTESWKHHPSWDQKGLGQQLLAAQFSHMMKCCTALEEISWRFCVCVHGWSSLASSPSLPSGQEHEQANGILNEKWSPIGCSQRFEQIMNLISKDSSLLPRSHCITWWSHCTTCSACNHAKKICWFEENLLNSLSNSKPSTS